MVVFVFLGLTLALLSFVPVQGLYQGGGRKLSCTVYLKAAGTVLTYSLNSLFHPFV